MERAARAIFNIPRKTPVLVYSESVLESNLRHTRIALDKCVGLRYQLRFAVKACYCLRVLEWMSSSGIGCEVISDLELRLATKAGFAGEKIVCNGAGRSDDLLLELCRIGALINVDSPRDLNRIGALAEASKIVCHIGIRLRPTVTLSNGCRHEHGKLGVEATERGIREFVAPVLGNKYVSIDCLSFHVAQNEVSPTRYEASIEQTGELRRILQRSSKQFQLRFVDIGGGMADSWGSQTQLDELLYRIGDASRRCLDDATVIFEPGRLMVGSAGFVLTTVLDIKRNGDRLFVIVDAGTNVLIPIPSATYRLVDDLRIEHGSVVADIVDGITNVSNVIVSCARFSKLPHIGQRIVLASCGAYTSAMAAFWVYQPMPILWLDREGQMSDILSADAIAQARRSLLGI